MNSLILSRSFAVAGEMMTHEAARGDGSAPCHHLCAHCVTRIYDINPVVPALIVLRADTLDGSETLRPAAHIWTKRKQPWIVLDPAVPCWTENPTGAEYRTVFL